MFPVREQTLEIEVGSVKFAIASEGNISLNSVNLLLRKKVPNQEVI